MALIKCPECGRDISIEASICPHCGCTSIPEKREQNFIGTVIAIPVVGLIALIVLATLNESVAAAATIVVPLIMVVIGLLIKNKVWKVLFIIWAIWTFFSNIGNLL